MEVKDLIIGQFEGVKRGIGRALDGLTQEEIAWRPAAGCNPIGLILLHIARSDDAFLTAKIFKQDQVWETDKWYEKLGLPASEEGAHYTEAQVDAFNIPPLQDIIAYADATRANVVAQIKGMTADQLDTKVETPFMGEVPLAMLLAVWVGHAAQHIGEMSYLRGLQRGMDK